MNQLIGTNNLAARHGETNNKFSGNKLAAQKTASYIETETYKAYLRIKSAAILNDSTPQQISLAFLYNHLSELVQYIRSKGETPSSANNGVVVQAVLLRMQDIHTISIAGNLDEDEALKEIQEAESQAFLLNTADKDDVLSPEIQASLNCLIVTLLDKMDASTGTSDISGALGLITQSMATPLNNFDPYGKNRATGDPSETELDFGFDPGLTDDPSLSSPGDISIGDISSPSLSNISVSAPSASGGLNLSSTTDTNGDNSDDFFTTLDKIAATAKTVSSSASTLSRAVSSGILGVSNAINTAGANVGASALSLYLQRNGLTILIIILIAVVLIMIFARASK